MARPVKCRCICSWPKTTRFLPAGSAEAQEPVTIGLDEYEVFRLLDYVHLSQQQCAEKMNISRTTVTRMYESARSKIARALVQGEPLTIAGGDVVVCKEMRPECRNEPLCCHRQEYDRRDRCANTNGIVET